MAIGKKFLFRPQVLVGFRISVEIVEETVMRLVKSLILLGQWFPNYRLGPTGGSPPHFWWVSKGKTR